MPDRHASPSVSLSDLQRVASNITNTLLAAILDLKTDIQAVATHLSDVEQTTQLHTAAIRQVQCIYDSQFSYLFDLHSQVEDLDNRGRRHNVRVRGVLEGCKRSAAFLLICCTAWRTPLARWRGYTRLSDLHFETMNPRGM